MSAGGTGVTGNFPADADAKNSDIETISQEQFSSKTEAQILSETWSKGRIFGIIICRV